MVERSGQTLEDVAVNESVDLLEKQEVIFVYGLGASSLVAQDIYQKIYAIRPNRYLQHWIIIYLLPC